MCFPLIFEGKKNSIRSAAKKKQRKFFFFFVREIKFKTRKQKILLINFI
jgi:hypothetical protein